jgi:hypothetical protein
MNPIINIIDHPTIYWSSHINPIIDGLKNMKNHKFTKPPPDVSASSFRHPMAFGIQGFQLEGAAHGEPVPATWAPC